MLFADTTYDPNAAAAAVGTGMMAIAGGIALASIVGLIVVLIPTYFIVKKAGYNGWLCLVQIIPLLNIVMLYVFAFSDWPIRRGQQQLGFATPPPFPPPGGPFGSGNQGGFAPQPPATPFGTPQQTNPFAPPPPASPFAPPSSGTPPPPPTIGGPPTTPTPWG